VTAPTDRFARLREFAQQRAERERQLAAQEPPRPEHIYVVAGNRAQFEAWCWDHDISPSDRRVVELYERGAMQRLAGTRGVHYVLTGTWEQRRDLPFLMGLLRNREAVLLGEVTSWGCRTTADRAPSPTRTGTPRLSS
jgi:hypothetical protein